MVAPAAAPVARALATAGPALVDKAKEMAPKVWNETRSWIANKMGTQSVDLRALAGKPESAAVVFEGLARHGFGIDDMQRLAPVLTKTQQGQFLESLRRIQMDVRSRNDANVVGVIGSENDAIRAAAIMSVTKQNVKRAALALGATTISELRLRLDAIRAITNGELVACELNSGELISNIRI